MDKRGREDERETKTEGGKTEGHSVCRFQQSHDSALERRDGGVYCVSEHTTLTSRALMSPLASFPAPVAQHNFPRTSVTTRIERWGYTGKNRAPTNPRPHDVGVQLFSRFGFRPDILRVILLLGVKLHAKTQSCFDGDFSPSLHTRFSDVLKRTHNPGWSEAIAPDGKTYYRNHKDKTTSWDRPVLAQVNNTPPGEAAAAAAPSGPKPRRRESAGNVKGAPPPLPPRRASVGNKCVHCSCCSGVSMILSGSISLSLYLMCFSRGVCHWWLVGWLTCDHGGRLHRLDRYGW